MEIDKKLRNIYEKHKKHTPFLFLENVHLQHHIYDTTIPPRIDTTLPDISNFDFVKNKKVELSTLERIEQHFDCFFVDGIPLDYDEKSKILSQKARQLFKEVNPLDYEKVVEECGCGGIECDFYNPKRTRVDCAEVMKCRGFLLCQHVFVSHYSYADEKFNFPFVVCKDHDRDFYWDQMGSFLDWCPLLYGGDGDYNSQIMLYNINPDCPLYHKVMILVEEQDSTYHYLLECTLDQACKFLDCLYPIINEEKVNEMDLPYPMVSLVHTFSTKFQVCL